MDGQCHKCNLLVVLSGLKIHFSSIKISYTNYNEDKNQGYFLEVNVQYPKKLHDFHNDLLFLPETMNIEKVENLQPTYTIKKEHVIHIRNLKQALNHGLVLKKVHRVIKFNQEAWLKPQIDINTKLRKNAKNDFKKDFFALMNSKVLGKTMKNVKKHRDIS